jgi:hypothetical protein
LFTIETIRSKLATVDLGVEKTKSMRPRVPDACDAACVVVMETEC